jgi:subtilisin-like proprotein convertase family protein
MLWPSASSAATCEEFTKVPGERFGFNDAVSTTTLVGGTNITDVDVRVRIVHPYVNDVSLYLTHNGGTINLSTNNGPPNSPASDYNDTVFDDAAATSITAGSPPFAGSYRPEQPLSALNGTSPAGTWTLTADDSFPSLDDGIFANWSLRITTVGDCPTNADDDNDGVLDTADNCPNDHNPGQQNSDPDALGDACDPDDDNDTVLDDGDNCRVIANVDQANHDEDADGDACDLDDDGDTVEDGADNCPLNGNGDQADLDQDDLGDACDDDDDGDGANDTADNCPVDENPDQADHDEDDVGDVCDSDDDGDSLEDGSDDCPMGDAAGTDTDGDGCKDAGEDLDDDDDNVNDGTDECDLLAAETSSGCPEASGTMTLRYKPRKNSFFGTLVTDGQPTCADARTVSIYRVVKGPDPDKLVGTTATGPDGAFSLKKKAKRGKHYAAADFGILTDVAACLAATSSSIRT